MSLRHLFLNLVRSAIFLITIALLWNLTTDEHNPLRERLLRAAIRSQLQPTPLIKDNRTALNSSRILSDIWKHDPRSTPNIYIGPLLQCHTAPHKHTNHIRVPDTPFFNVSFSEPADGAASSSSDKQYFNPTLIPLPPWSPHPYLLISRLVTPGLHQESHVCFAAFCAPDSSTSSSSRNKYASPDTRSCVADETDNTVQTRSNNRTTDHSSILPTLRCIAAPHPLNIPPTPARKCQGAWSAFPDIPGFHDPRAFWSGNGEPLIIVNSGSQFGCVGLWVVDLRTVVSGLQDILESGRRSIGSGSSNARGEGWKGMISYSHLTEITRAEGREAVEKNWVLFFPRADEGWVMYDVLGRRKKGTVGVETEAPWQVTEAMKAGDELESKQEPLANDRMVAETSLHRNSSNKSGVQEGRRANGSVINLGTYLKGIRFEDIKESTESDTSHLSTQTGYRNLTSKSELEGSSSRRGIIPRNPLEQPPSDPIAYSPPIIPSRTFAKLIGHGFTTPNLTSPFEPPCFDSSHVLDPLNNPGHWHQGSNALRLVLCHRRNGDSHRCQLTSGNEAEMVQRGQVVHFMVMHRKFSNEMDLPMRYERYFMVWEARWPFRIVGVSRHPVLFGDEMARPWTEDENFDKISHGDGDENGGEEVAWKLEKRDHAQMTEGEEKNVASWVRDAYFTYTPSLAWSWRGRVDNGDEGGLRADLSLGSGYLDDEVIVGVGVDDIAQAVVKVKAETLLSCLRLCPGFESAD